MRTRKAQPRKKAQSRKAQPRKMQLRTGQLRQGALSSRIEEPLAVQLAPSRLLYPQSCCVTGAFVSELCPVPDCSGQWSTILSD